MVNHDDFESFVLEVQPTLHRALLGTVGVDRVDDAVGEALAYGFEHWSTVSTMSNPVGYLFRVGQSRTRSRKHPQLFKNPTESVPDIDPDLSDALMALPDTQRTAIWLAHGCGWQHTEIAEVMGIGTSTVSTHVARALRGLRSKLGVAGAHA
jgi:RNA polymerase sigma factor (sigma-70 family)